MPVSQENELRRLRERVESMTDALGFYADPDNWREQEGTWTEGRRTHSGWRVPAHEDRGRKAKTALED